jgi:hypothetical protein
LTARGPGDSDPDAVRAWALAEIERLESIPAEDLRRPIAEQVLSFWRRRLDDSRADGPGEPHEGDET